MATWHIDSRATGSNNGAQNGTADVAGIYQNAWQTLYDSAYGTNSGSPAAGDTIVLHGGPFYEATHTNSALRVRASDISFNAAARTITSQASNLLSYTAGKTIRIMGSQSNDGQKLVSSVAGSGPYVITLDASCTLVDETAGNSIRIVDITPSSSRSFVLDHARNGSAGNPITWDFNGCEISAGMIVSTSAYKWNASVKTGEYYLTRSDGSNPCLVQPESAVVNGNYMCASAQEAAHNRGTVGSLSFDGQYGFGANGGDSLAYNTLYVRSTSGNPTALGWTVIVGQIYSCLHQNFTNNTFTNNASTLAFMSFGNGSANGGTDGSNANLRGTNTILRGIVGRWADGQMAATASTGTYIIDGCVAFWTGHRLANQGSDCTLKLYNNVAHGTHLIAVMGAGTSTHQLSASSVLEAKGNVCVRNESGAFDKKGAPVSFSNSTGLLGTYQAALDIFTNQAVTFSSSTGLLGTYATDLASFTPVTFISTGALPTGLTAGVTYWTIRQSATTSKFATSLANAVAGTAIAFTDAGSGTITMTTWYPQATFQSVGGSLPTGLAANTYYFLVRFSATTFKIATTLANAQAGTFVAFTDAGSGTLTVSYNILDEDYNHFAPTLDDSTQKLGYVNTGHWFKTAVHDSPASVLTTTGPGNFTDPKFTALSDTDPNACNYRPAAGSPLAGTGPWNAGSSFKGIDGVQYTGGQGGFARALNKGVYQNVVSKVVT